MGIKSRASESFGVAKSSSVAEGPTLLATSAWYDYIMWLNPILWIALYKLQPNHNPILLNITLFLKHTTSAEEQNRPKCQLQTTDPLRRRQSSQAEETTPQRPKDNLGLRRTRPRQRKLQKRRHRKSTWNGWSWSMRKEKGELKCVIYQSRAKRHTRGSTRHSPIISTVIN
jgi:hypothetical protein